MKPIKGMKLVVLALGLLGCVHAASAAPPLGADQIQMGQLGSTSIAPGKTGVWSPSSGLNANLPVWRRANGSDIPMTGAGAGGGYTTVEQAGIALTQRDTINFVLGATCVDNPGQTRTDCTLHVGTVTNVSTDATLTGGPITTTGALGINLTNPNTWTGLQGFNGGAAFGAGATASGASAFDLNGSSGTWRPPTGGLNADLLLAADNTFNLGDVSDRAANIYAFGLVAGNPAAGGATGNSTSITGQDGGIDVGAGAGFGGTISINAGAGGSSSLFGQSGQGGAITLIAGGGGVHSSGGTARAGGEGLLEAGNGGASTSGSPGLGGQILVRSGTGGANSSNTTGSAGGDGGLLQILGGNGGAGGGGPIVGGNGATVLIDAGVGGANGGVNGSIGLGTSTAGPINIGTTGSVVTIVVEAFHLVGNVGEPAFQNGAINFGAPFSTAGFFKDPFGVVHLKGVIVIPGSTGIVFTLPVGYRPATELFAFVTTTDNGGAYRAGHLRINTGGDVDIIDGDPTLTSFDGITFSTM
jgi:hypothetical protein